MQGLEGSAGASGIYPQNKRNKENFKQGGMCVYVCV